MHAIRLGPVRPVGLLSRVLSSALPLDNLDLNELDATLSDVDLALTRHVPTLHDLATE